MRTLFGGLRRGDWLCVGWEVDGVEGFGAAEADCGVVCVVAYVGDVAPAAVALGLLRALPRTDEPESRRFDWQKIYFGDVEELRKRG